MAAVLPPGLAIAGALPRANPLDAIVLPVRLKADTTANTRVARSVRLQPDHVASVDDVARVLDATPSIGTGSVRRIAQLMRLFTGARVTGIRGNLDTRLRKLDEGAHDPLVLAAAGPTRPGFGPARPLSIPADACVPAPGQGIVAIAIREDNERAREAVARINDAAAGDALSAERALVATLGGGCQPPVGALASIVDGDHLELIAVVAALDGSRVVRGTSRAPRNEAAALGADLGRQLLADGAAEILRTLEL